MNFKDIYEHIYEAQMLALKNQIKVNSVIIDKNFAINYLVGQLMRDRTI